METEFLKNEVDNHNQFIHNLMFLLESSTARDMNLKDVKMKKLTDMMNTMTIRFVNLDDFAEKTIEKMSYYDHMYIQVKLVSTTACFRFAPETLSLEVKWDEKNHRRKYILLHIGDGTSVELDLDEIDEIKRVYMDFEDENNTDSEMEEMIWCDEHKQISL